MSKFFSIFFLTFLFQNLVFCQVTDYDKLYDANREYIFTNLDLGLVKCKQMESMAKREKSEYGLLQTYKLYSEIFIAQNEYKKVLNYSQKMKDLAEKLDKKHDIANAHRMIGLNYCEYDLLDKSLNEFNQGLKILEGIDDEQSRFVRGFIYESASEVYSLKNEVPKMIEFIKKAKFEFEQIKNSEEKSRLLQNTYNNLGIAYLDNIDSCSHYFEKAKLLINEKSQKNTVASIYLGLGYVNAQKKNFKDAIIFLRASLSISKSSKNLEFEAEANSQMAQVYYDMKDSVNGNLYKNIFLKLNDSISKRKVSVTKDIVATIEKESSQKANSTKYKLVSIIIVIIFLLFFLGKMFLNKSKDEEIVKKERDMLLVENTALKNEVSRISNPAAYEIEEIVLLAKTDQSIFYSKFQEVFPNFISKILEVAPTLVLTELQLCAYLRLNFSTKEIAIYTKSSVESINQKKYRLRKKMNIPPGEDINIWMSKF